MPPPFRPAAAAVAASDDSELGLDATEAARRLQADGYNELASARPRRLSAIVFEVLREPMLLLLLACGGIYLALGDKREASMLLFFVVVVIAITLVQRRKSERALDALKHLSSPRALVIRRAPRCRIPGREVVVGDLVVLSEGDRVPADGLLVHAINLCADESLLTGESVAVRKLPAADTAQPLPPPGGDDLAGVYAGSLIVQGNGLLQVTATGANTAIGRIGKALASIETDNTPLQREVGSVVARVAVAGLALSALVAIGYGLPRDAWLEGLLVGITLAMGLLPEELPVILTLFLSIGAWRLAQKNVLTRRTAALETLGTTTVLCVDKTGTLTENRMRLQALISDSQTIDIDANTRELPERFHALLEFALLASHRNPFDPMELAIHNAVAATLADTEHVHKDWRLVEEYPLSPELLAMSRVWHSTERAEYAIAAKGAPEAIVDLCHLDAARAEQVRRAVAELAARGLRVLGVARASFALAPLPEIQHDFNFEFLGVIGLADPIRADVPAAIEECRRAGVRVVMITGDHPATALNIAQQIGLDCQGGHLGGAELEALNDLQLAQQLRRINVFCRVSPEQKLRLVNALRNNGEIVAMTGDGVNDAPAIRAAHVGIAMGARGTDVAREAADIVLMDDAFAALVNAVRMGRRTYANLRKAVTFALAVHMPIIGLSLLPVLLGWPLILMPIHILCLQLLIDPACSIVFEAAPGDAKLMRQPPRARSARLFDTALLTQGLWQGLLLFAVLAGVYALSWQLSGDSTQARTTTYAAMILANLGLILSNLSVRGVDAHNPVWRMPLFRWLGAVTLLALTAILALPPLHAAFHFVAPTPLSAALMIASAVFSFFCFELIKRLRRVTAPPPPHR
jgi:Ca2+-transporting ATPase